MKFIRKYPTHNALSNLVKSYWILNIENAGIPVSQLYFPYGSFELVFYIKGSGIMQYVATERRIKQPELSYSGQFTKPFFLHFDTPCKCLGVSLKPWAGSFLFNIPSNKFTDEIIELSGLGEYEIDPNTTDDAMFTQVEKYLLKQLNLFQLDKMSAHLAQMLFKSPDRQTANQVIDSIGLSRRRIEQKFLANTGLSIGAFSRKIRFQKAVNLLGQYNAEESLTGFGLSAGYYDQSHFISEFKEFTSVTPSVYLKQKNDLQKFLAALSGT